MGQGALCHSDAQQIFNYCLNLYIKYFGKLAWNGFIITNLCRKSRALDLEFFNKNLVDSRSFIKNIYQGRYKLLYLLSADEIDFDSNEEYICNLPWSPWRQSYKRADLIIPMSCFTEKEGFIN